MNLPIAIVTQKLPKLALGISLCLVCMLFPAFAILDAAPAGDATSAGVQESCCSETANEGCCHEVPGDEETQPPAAGPDSKTAKTSKTISSAGFAMPVPGAEEDSLSTSTTTAATALTEQKTAPAAKRFGRACLVIEKWTNAAAPQPDESFIYGDNFVPGDHHYLRLYLDASTPCKALVIALDPFDGSLWQGTKPVVLDLEGVGHHAVHPAKPVGWPWTYDNENVRIFVVFMPLDNENTTAIAELTTAIQETANSDLLTIQTEELRKQIDQWQFTRNVVAWDQPRAVGTSAGTMFFGDSLTWRTMALKADFSEPAPWMLVFDVDAPDKVKY